MHSFALKYTCITYFLLHYPTKKGDFMSFNFESPIMNGRTNSTNGINGPKKTDSQQLTRAFMRHFLENYHSDIGLPSESELRNALESAGATNIQISINKYEENGKQVADVNIKFSWGGEDFDQSRKFELTAVGDLTGTEFKSDNKSDGELSKINFQDFSKPADSLIDEHKLNKD